MGFCGNLKVAICGNFEYPKIASAEGFELFSCLAVDSSGLSSRRGRALKLSGPHSPIRSFPGFPSIGGPPLPMCSPTCNQTSQIRRSTAVEEGLLSCRQADNNWLIDRKLFVKLTHAGGSGRKSRAKLPRMSVSNYIHCRLSFKYRTSEYTPSRCDGI